MTFDFGTFVVGLFSLVLAALENYFFYRPPSAATSLLLRREATAAAVAAVPTLVLFFLRGRHEAAAGAVFLVVLRAGFYFLYRRTLPYVPPGMTRGNRRAPPSSGDKIISWWSSGTTTRFRDLLESGAAPTAAQRAWTCEPVQKSRINLASVLTTNERYIYKDVKGKRDYTYPKWYEHPWLHRLHKTARERFERYRTEFAAEREAYDILDLPRKVRRENTLIAQRREARRLGQRFPKEVEKVRPQRLVQILTSSSDINITQELKKLSKTIKKLRKKVEDKPLLQRGMVLRVLTCVGINQ